MHSNCSRGTLMSYGDHSAQHRFKSNAPIDCIYLDAERLYDHIKRETFQTRALTPPPCQARVKRARKRYYARSAHSSNTCTKVPARAVACIISYQTAKETTCMQCPSYAVS